MHPDKRSGDEDEEFILIKKAYGYLNNSVTKLIYDSYGVPGLIMYDRYKDQFSQQAIQLRNLDAMSDIQRDGKYQWRKRLVEYEILLRANNFLRYQVKTNSKSSTEQNMHIDLTMNAKAFCNLYHKFYYAGQTSQIFKLIRYKYMQAHISVTVPWLSSDGSAGSETKHKT